MENLKSILDSLAEVGHSNAKMPQVDLIKVLDEVLGLYTPDVKALGITIGKYVTQNGDISLLSDQDVLTAVMPHVSKETYKQMVAASKDGKLEYEFGHRFESDSGDGLYRVLEPIARKRGLFNEDFNFGSDVYFLSYPATKQTSIVIAADWYDYEWHAPKLYKSVEELEEELLKDRAIELFELSV
jgi:hypothetical protein